MSITVAQFKSKVTPKLHGTTLAKVGNVNELLEEASGNLILRIDPYPTIRRSRLENAIYDKVYNYTAPSDLKGINKIVDARPIGTRETTDDIRGTYSQNFDIRKEINTMTVEVIDGVKTFRIAKELDNTRTVVHALDSLTLGGVVTGSNDVTNLQMNYFEHVSNNASIQFDLSGATGVGTITIALDTTIDMEKLEDLGALFQWLKFPDASDLTSVELKWGDDASAYWSKTVTAFHDRAFEDNTWGLLRHDWSDATQTGSPDSSAVAWLQININYSNAQSNVFMDSITSALGEAWEILYYSDAIFKDATTGEWKTKPTADSDIIMLDNSGINGLLYEFMVSLSQESKGKNANADLKFYNDKLHTPEIGFYDRYDSEYPSQAIEMQIDYYDFDELSGY